MESVYLGIVHWKKSGEQEYVIYHKSSHGCSYTTSGITLDHLVGYLEGVTFERPQEEIDLHNGIPQELMAHFEKRLHRKRADPLDKRTLRDVLRGTGILNKYPHLLR